MDDHPEPAVRPGLLRPIEDAALGRTVCAAVPIRRGELLFHEAPLLRSVEVNTLPQDVQALFKEGAEALEFPWALTAICNLQAYTTAASQVRQQVLSQFCSYDVHTSALPSEGCTGSASVGAAAANALPVTIGDAMRVSRWWLSQVSLQPPTVGRESFSAEELTRAQCCFDLNAHEFEQSLALFAQSSRLTHCCGGANTAYHFAGGRACHRALREIPEGEVLTSCYSGARAAFDRPTRQAHLRRDYLFECRCKLCQEKLDSRRSLPCPSCGLQRDPETGLLPEVYIEVCSQHTHTHYGMCAADNDGCWHCNSCEKVSSSAEMNPCIDLGSFAEFLPTAGLSEETTVLSCERAICDIVASQELGLGAAPGGSWQPDSPIHVLQAMTQLVSRVLGSDHWASIKIEEILLDAMLMLAIKGGTDDRWSDSEDGHDASSSEDESDDAAPTTYECENDCGFCGSFDEVAAHESACNREGCQVHSPAPRDGAQPETQIVEWNIFSFTQPGGEHVQICVQDENTGDFSAASGHTTPPELGGRWTGGTVWQGSHILAELLVSQPSEFVTANPRVVELGCGVGLVGLTAAALGAQHVALTDMETSVAAHNLEQCGLAAETRRRVHVSNLKWGCEEQLEQVLGPERAPFDLVLGSDIMYNRAHFSALADTISKLTVPGSTVLWVTHDGSPTSGRQRKWAAPFYDRLRASGFDMFDITASGKVQSLLCTDAPGNAQPGRGPPCVVQMVRRCVLGAEIWNRFQRQHDWFEHRGFDTARWTVKGLRLAMDAWPALAAFVECDVGRAGWLRGVERLELERTQIEHGIGSASYLRLVELGFGSPCGVVNWGGQ